MTPNIGKPLRVSYVVIGLILVLLPLLKQGLDTWVKVAAPVVGLMALITGVTGW